MTARLPDLALPVVYGYCQSVAGRVNGPSRQPTKWLESCLLARSERTLDRLVSPKTATKQPQGSCDHGAFRHGVGNKRLSSDEDGAAESESTAPGRTNIRTPAALTADASPLIRRTIIRAALTTAALLAVLMYAPVARSGTWVAPLRGAQAVPPFWQALADCETGGLWDWGAKRRPKEGPLYEGGVGFAASTWRLWAGGVGVLRRYPHAYLAPPLVQVRVGRYGLARRGNWGCLHKHPWIYSLPGR